MIHRSFSLLISLINMLLTLNSFIWFHHIFLNPNNLPLYSSLCQIMNQVFHQYELLLNSIYMLPLKTCINQGLSNNCPPPKYIKQDVLMLILLP